MFSIDRLASFLFRFGVNLDKMSQELLTICRWDNFKSVWFWLGVVHYAYLLSTIGVSLVLCNQFSRLNLSTYTRTWMLPEWLGVSIIVEANRKRICKNIVYVDEDIGRHFSDLCINLCIFCFSTSQSTF